MSNPIVINPADVVTYFECHSCGSCPHKIGNPFHRCKEWAPLPIYSPDRADQHRRAKHEVKEVAYEANRD